MAILTAMNSEEVEVIGLTTVFGNVYTDTATKNAFKILEVAGRRQVLLHTHIASHSKSQTYADAPCSVLSPEIHPV